MNPPGRRAEPHPLLARSRGRLTATALAILLFAAATAVAATATLAPGAKLDELPVGSVTYRQVVVRSINARTVMITHAAGMSSIHLRDLAPAWQARFGYDPKAEAAAEIALSPATAPAPRHPASPTRAAPRVVADGAFEQMLRQFGQPAVLQADVDLRPKYFQLELGVKNQGRRPSCAVFAIVSALELQNAEVNGRPEKFSEEYLIWATRKTVQRFAPPPENGGDASATSDDADEGFALLEVVSALRAYGIPLQSSMPNTFGRAMETIADPPAAIVDEARQHERVFIHLVPGRDNATRINNLVQALNAGVPVPVGLAWPNYRTLRNGYLSQQQPVAGTGHAVTLVGYHSPSGRMEDARFVFKNSWGVDWGQAGYGQVTYEYLLKHLHSAVVLEVQPGAASAGP